MTDSAMITSAEFLKRRQANSPNVYMHGNKIDVPVDHP